MYLRHVLMNETQAEQTPCTVILITKHFPTDKESVFHSHTKCQGVLCLPACHTIYGKHSQVNVK